jgi:acetoacetate decarboxylase
MESGYTFGAGGFAVACRHGEVDGFYPLTMPMGGEAAVVGGREIYGEPKKLADISLDVSDDKAIAKVSRMGVTYMEIQAQALADADSSEQQEASLDFYFKFLVAPDFKGFDQDPSLVYCRRDTAVRNARKMQGEVILRDSDFDPVADLPVRRMVDITLSERQASQHGELIQQVPSDWISPYAHQRYDQFSWA